MIEQSKQASGLDRHASNDLVTQRYASRCRSTELHEDLVIVADLPIFTVHLLNVNECRNTIVRSSSPVDGEITFV